MAAALALLTLACFANALPRTFVNYDDDVYITDNAHVKNGLAPAELGWALTTFHAANWHPATWISHMFDVQLFGLDARKHHLVNLLLHAANAAILFLLLARMTGAAWCSAFAAALFAIHPLHVESFAWIAERKDVLSTLLWLLTTAAWLRYLRLKTAAAYVPVTLLYALGLMAKPMLVTLPFTLLLLDVWPLRRLALSGKASRSDWTRLVREKAPLFALSAASCVVTSIAQGRGGAVQDLMRYPLEGRIANAFVAYAAYLGKTVWPSGLAVFYPYRPFELSSWPVLGAVLAVAGATALALAFKRRAPYVAFGWFWYVGTLVPVIGLVQVGGQSMADRYTYVPLIGLFVAVAWGWADAFGRTAVVRTIGVAAACAWLVALSAASQLQLGTWADRKTLFRHAAAVTTDNCLAHEKLGVTLLDEGDIAGAITHLNEAIRILPGYPDAHYNLGLAMVRQGRPADAVEEFKQVIQLDPTSAIAHNNLGGAYIQLGRLDAALEEINAAIRIDPASREAHFNLANLLAQTGRDADAVEAYAKALGGGSDDAEALDRLALALTRLERWPEAVERFRQELRLRPRAPEVHNSLGIALARMGRMSEALAAFREAVRLAPGYEEAADNVRRAEAALGQR